jgi:hypothetical protein
MLKDKNFYNYLNEKYDKIDRKIQRRLKIIQKGGAINLAKIQIELEYLKQLKNILQQKKDIGKKLDLNIISEPLDKIIKDLNEVASRVNKGYSKELDDNSARLQLLLNQIQTIESKISDNKEGYIQVELKKLDKFITPKIDIPTIKNIHEQLIEEINKNINDILSDLDKKTETSTNEFQSKVIIMKEQNIKINDNIKKMIEFIKIIKEKIDEIKKYMNIELKPEDISKELFMSPDDFISQEKKELITIQKLEALILKADEKNEGLMKTFSQYTTLPKIDEKQIIKPDLLNLMNLQPTQPISQSKQRGGNIYLYKKEDVEKIINEIYKKWQDKVNEYIQYLSKSEEERQAELKRLLSIQGPKNKEIISRIDNQTKKFAELKEKLTILLSKTKEIQQMIENYIKQIGEGILDINCKDIIDDYTTYYNDINNQMRIIYDKYVNIKTQREKGKPILNESEFDNLNKDIDTLNYQLDEYIINTQNKTMDNGKERCNEKMKRQINEYINIEIKDYDKLLLNIKNAKLSISGQLKLESERIKMRNNLINIQNIDDKLRYYKLLMESNEFEDIFSNLGSQIYTYITEKEQKLQKELCLLKEKKECQAKDEIYSFIIEKIGFTKRDLITKPFGRLIKNKLKEKITRLYNIYNLVNKIIQKGGSINHWENYYSIIINTYMSIYNYKEKYNEFAKYANEFNLLYIQLYYHQYYIAKYIEETLLKDSYTVYQNISRGSVNYYRTIIKEIIEKCEKNPELNGVTQYFYKYHYITLKLLFNFLDSIRKPDYWGKINNVKIDPSEIVKMEESRNSSRLLIIPRNDTEQELISQNLKKGFFLFNIFKDILDEYAYTLASPVAVYLRVNDWETAEKPVITNPVFVKDENKPERFNTKNLDNCRVVPAGETPDKLNRYKTILGNIEFREIFDPIGFSDNAILAQYMGIPGYLNKKKSIMLITYGYSGVGKTFTIFGSATKQGILQKALLDINGKDKIFTRTYEIYGKALPYKSYWDRNADEYDHSIYTYTPSFDESGTLTIDEPIEIKGGTMKTYLRKIKEENSDTYNEINDKNINVFGNIVSEVDKIREKEGRIKKTINNPVSSRSIMVYEFKVLLKKDKDNKEKWVRFVVMDLPGKEDIKNTYVKPSGIKDSELVEYCIKTKNNIINPGNKYNNDALRSAIFLNPYFISVFPDIAKNLIQFIKKSSIFNDIKDKPIKVATNIKEQTIISGAGYNVISRNKISSTDNNQTIVIKDTNKEPNNEYTVKKILSEDYKLSTALQFSNIDEKQRDSFDKFINENENNDVDTILENWRKDFKDFKITKYTVDNLNKMLKENKNILNAIKENQIFYYCQIASEIMRILLENNHINTIIDFYNDYLIDEYKPEDKTENQCKLNNFGALPFEGFYINENILGLVKTLKKRLEGTSSTIQTDNIMEDVFSKEMGKDIIIKKDKEGNITNISNLYEKEIDAQTYFTRGLLRESYFIKGNNIILASKTNESNYTNTNYKNKPIQYWFEEMYDFNKSYTKEPPIETFMEAYFEIEDQTIKPPKYVIDNFYLFYVVSNMNEGKCGNQIKLISDSKNFIDIIKSYKPPVNKEEQTNNKDKETTEN